jgi:hypothetical protein
MMKKQWGLGGLCPYEKLKFGQKLGGGGQCVKNDTSLLLTINVVVFPI